MDLVAIREALQDNLESITGVQINTEPLADPTAPALEIDLDDPAVDYHQAMQNGLQNLHLIVRGFYGNAGSKEASLNRDVWLTNDLVKAAIESDKTLGGAARDLMVIDVRPRTFASAAQPNTTFLGLEWSVLIYPA